MKIPKRFALSTLLLLMLVVASVFGYAQWRKQRLQSRLAEINKREGWQIGVSEEWFWPKPVLGPVISYNRNSDNKFYKGGKILTDDEVRSRNIRLSNELEEIGVTFISFVMMCEKEVNGRMTAYSMQFDSADEFHKALDEGF